MRLSCAGVAVPVVCRRGLDLDTIGRGQPNGLLRFCGTALVSTSCFAFILGANLLRVCERLPEVLLSAASAISAPTSCLLGLLNADIASFSSASTISFFLCLGSSPVILLLRDRDPGRADLSSPQSDFIRGMLISEGDSPPSFFRPGMAISVAERSAATALLGPRDMLRRSRWAWSVEKARWRDLGFLVATERFVTAPGRGCLAGAFGLGCFVLGETRIGGPPSFLFRESQSSGSREEKLDTIVSELQQHRVDRGEPHTRE